MRICFIGNANSPHARTPVMDMQALGHDTVLVGFEPTDDVFTVQPPSAKPYSGLLRSFTTLGTFIKRLKFFKNLDHDVYHAYDASKPAAMFALAVGKHPLVVTVLGGDVLYAEREDMDVSWSDRQLIKLLVSHCSLLTVRSDPMRASVLAMGADPKRIINEPFGVDLEVYSPGPADHMRKRLGLSDDARIVFSSRNATSIYNIDLIIRSFALVAKQIPNAHLLVAEGNAAPEYAAALRQEVRKLDLENSVTFLGRLKLHEMIDCYRLADVAVSMAATDGMPRSLKESLACGTPCVLSPLERYKEIVTHEQSALFADFTPESVSESIVRLLSDDQLAETIREGGKQAARVHADQRRSSEEMIAKYADLLRQGNRTKPSVVARSLVLSLLVGKTLWQYPVNLFQRLTARSQ